MVMEEGNEVFKSSDGFYQVEETSESVEADENIYYTDTESIVDSVIFSGQSENSPVTTPIEIKVEHYIVNNNNDANDDNSETAVNDNLDNIAITTPSSVYLESIDNNILIISKQMEYMTMQLFILTIIFIAFSSMFFIRHLRGRG